MRQAGNQPPLLKLARSHVFFVKDSSLDRSQRINLRF